MSACKSCSARIRWATTITGKAMPVDADPDPAGNVVLERDELGGFTQATVLTGDDLARARAEQRTHLPHFVTCPNAGKHRRRARG